MCDGAPADLAVGERGDQEQPGTRGHVRDGQGVERGEHHRVVAAARQPGPVDVEQLAEQRGVVGEGGVVQRPDHVAVFLPCAGHPSVQRREPVRAAAPQVRAQLGAQEGMDPEGAARGTGPGDERRRALQLREHVPGVGALREAGGERGGDLVADTDGGEHVGDVGG